MSNPSQPTVTAANILSGDKTFRTVQFAVTGDVELDLIAGVIAVFAPEIHPCTSDTNVRVLKYLLDRYQSRVDSERHQREAMERMQGMAGGYPPQKAVNAGPAGTHWHGSAGAGNLPQQQRSMMDEIKSNLMSAQAAP